MINANQIYEEDCLTFMEKLGSQNTFVDVIVTSPPYNINKEYRTYDDNKKKDDYFAWLEEVGKKIKSVLKNGSFFLNISGRPSDPTLPFDLAARLTKNVDFNLQNTIHWIKSVSVDPEDIGRNNGFHNSDNISIGHFKPIVSDRYLSDLHEYIFHFTKNGNVKLEKLKIGVTYQDKTNIGRWKTATRDRRDRGNVWFIPYPTVQEARPHPAVFPVKLPERCIQLHGIKKNMLVYDPFIGIGTTALACIHLKVNYIGTEIDSQYIGVAKQRISDYLQTNFSK
jgi:site-specific DNA-methyltransferase (adenine-specific)